MRLVKIKCGTCGVEFMPKSERNKYCTRSCFKKAFYHRKKAEELKAQKTPSFKCPSCDQHIILPFNPVDQPGLWAVYICPGCNTLMIRVSENIVTQDHSIG